MLVLKGIVEILNHVTLYFIIHRIWNLLLSPKSLTFDREKQALTCGAEGRQVTVRIR